MASKVKVLDINDRGFHLECIEIRPKSGEKIPVNPYLLYIVYHAPTRYGYGYSKHRKLLKKYGDFTSVLCHIKDIYLYGMDRMPVNVIAEWSRNI